jgi:hypothetical protein
MGILSADQIDELSIKSGYKFGGICELYMWSTNYEDMYLFRLFLDLIDYSIQRDGVVATNVFGLRDGFRLGILEVEFINGALSDYVHNPSGCYKFLDSIIELENEENE